MTDKQKEELRAYLQEQFGVNFVGDTHLETIEQIVTETRPLDYGGLWEFLQKDLDVILIDQDLQEIEGVFIPIEQINREAQKCQCGKPEDEKYSPCCSLEHWHQRFCYDLPIYDPEIPF